MFTPQDNPKMRVLGLKETQREAREENLQLVVLAEDCDEVFKGKVKALGVKVLMATSRSELGRELGLDVPCGVVGILKSEKK